MKLNDFKINRTFWSNVVVVATVVLATNYLEDRISNKIEQAMNPLRERIEHIESRVNRIESDLYDIKYEAIKPKKIKIKPQ